MRILACLIVTAGTVFADSNVKVTSAASPTVGITPGALASVSGLQVALDIGAFPIVRGAGALFIRVTDANGVARTAAMSSVYSSHIEFEVPEGTAPGPGTVEVEMTGAPVTAPVTIVPVAPALFAVNDRGVAAASAVRVVLSTHEQGPVNVFQCTDTAGSCQLTPIDVGVDAPVYITFYGTGIRHRSSLANVMVTIGTETAKPTYAGPQPQAPGLDQINVLLPLALHGAGEVSVTVTVDGVTSNPVKIAIQ